MLVKFGSSEWFREASKSVWKATAKLRQQFFHGTHACSQSVDPLSLPFGVIGCQPCTELHHRALMVGAQRLKRDTPRLMRAVSRLPEALHRTVRGRLPRLHRGD